MIVRNAAYNLLGMGAPLVVAIFTIPILIDQLGVAKFGILTLIWAIVSYLSLLDLGLGRTLTLQISAYDARGDGKGTDNVTSTALWIMLFVGALGALGLILVAPSSASLLADASDAGEIAPATVAMAFALPAITLTSGFRGVLEARHRFAILNIIRVPFGIYTFVGPLIAVWLAGPRLDVVAWFLVAGRYVALGAHALFAIRSMPIRSVAFDPTKIRALFTTGGWLTVSNVISPLMGYADRFVIGATVSAAAVTYYVTPYEVVTKLSIVPAALTGVLFPTFASLIAARSEHAAPLFGASLKILSLVLLPICAALAAFSREILEIWIGPDFATHSAPLLQIFAVGIFMNCLAYIPFTLIQSAGKASITAIIHVLEAAPFVLFLWLAAREYGAIGAAAAWLARVAIDTLALFFVSRRLQTFSWRSAAPLAALSVAAFSIQFMHSLSLKIACIGIVTLACTAFTLSLLRSQGLSLQEK